MILVDFANHLYSGDLSPRTRRAYVDHLTLFARWFQTTNGYELDQTNLTQVDAREYRQALVTGGAAPATVNAKLAALRSFAKWCDIKFDVKDVEQQAVAPRWLDRREQAALLREAERTINATNGETRKAAALRDYAIVTLLLNTGLRISELIALQPGDVTLNERSGKLVVRQGKGGKQREVPLNKDARSALVALTLPLTVKARQLQKVIEEIGRRAGIECTPHTLRHTFAKNLSDGVASDRVAALLGHSNLNTTRRYTTPGAQDLQQAVETLE